MEYIYNNKITSPALEQIHLDITASSMTDKSIEWCRWDEATEELKVVFDGVLSAEDKIILDGVVSNN